MKPKVLICTIESWNSKVGANTFSSLFTGWPAENLANVYIREELPDSPCCSRYFRISENQVIKSVVKRRLKTGKEVAACQQSTEADEKMLSDSRELYNKNRKKRSVAKLFVRELLWKCGKWKTPELDAFVDSFQPDIVVFGMEGYIHFNRICRYIVKRTGAKAVGYFWDDNFTYRQRGHLLNYRILRFFQRRSLKKLAPKCHAFWAITDKTKQEADEFFGIDCQVLTKPIDFAPGEKWQPYSLHTPVKMLYTGNLLIGRFDSILAVSEALKKINADGVKIELDVYSGSYITPEDQAKLSEFVHMKGVVPQSEVLKLQEQADVLLFAEAMSGDYSQIARLSFSTKLTDYFRSGKCIFAIGAKDVAPVEYLIAENAALCASTNVEILEVLDRIVTDPSLILQTGQNAFLCGMRNHSRTIIENKIQQTFQTLAHKIDI